MGVTTTIKVLPKSIKDYIGMRILQGKSVVVTLEISGDVCQLQA